MSWMQADARRTREWTCLVIDAMDEGVLDPRAVADMCLAYMSEDEVEDMCRANDLKQYLKPEEDEEDDETDD